jgi:redox-sensing transcriptional repressor
VAAAARRIPEATILRLPVYQRLLQELRREGVTTVSSDQLANMARLNASKVRKDLSFLGSFGTRGSGYEVGYLLEQIDRELGLDRDWPMVIVGIGNLGRALAQSPGFRSRGFRISGLFDVNPDLLGTTVNGVEIRHIEELGRAVAADPPAIGVITTPPRAAQDVANRLVAVGVGSLLNFAPRVLSVPPDVLVRYVDLSIELQVMSFYLSHRTRPEDVAAAAVPHAVGLSSREPL